ncbi:unnamed protein product, partial [Laminaria digitata]
MHIAIKLDECTPRFTLMPRLLDAAFTNLDPEMAREVSRDMSDLEWRICQSFRMAVLPETPLTFLHLFLARAVSVGALLKEQTGGIGEVAAQTSLRWLRAGYLAGARPSELAAAALELAVFR